MKIKINTKNLKVNLLKEEIQLINMIIDEIDFNDLRKITSGVFKEDKLTQILKSLYEKKVVNIDTPALLNVGNFERSGSVYMYSNTNISEQIEGLYKKIKDKKNYYEILGVTPDTDINEIKYVYFRLSKKYHPDIIKRYNLPENIKEQVDFVMMEISNIFNTLKVPEKRKEYDKKLNIFRNRLTKVKKSDTNTPMIEKSIEYYKLAENEFKTHNYSKALNLLKLSLSYNPKNKDALALKEEAEKMFDKEKTLLLLKDVDNLIASRDYDSAFEKINDLIIEFGNNKKFLVKKVKILEYMGFEKNKYKIINLLKSIVQENPADIKTGELLLEYLKLAGDKKQLKEEAGRLLEADPNNKTAKKYAKGKLWNMF